MPVVLAKRILKPESFLTERLRPTLLLSRAEDPSIHILCLDYEYSEDRNNYVIYLCRAITSRDKHVIDSSVQIRVKKQT